MRPISWCFERRGHTLTSWCLFIGSVQEGPKAGGSDPEFWTVDDVVRFIREIDPLLAPHADRFRKHVRCWRGANGARVSRASVAE